MKTKQKKTAGLGKHGHVVGRPKTGTKKPIASTKKSVPIKKGSVVINGVKMTTANGKPIAKPSNLPQKNVNLLTHFKQGNKMFGNRTIGKVEYNAKDQNMTVSFLHRDKKNVIIGMNRYKYTNVSPKIAIGMVKSDSVLGHFSKVVKPRVTKGTSKVHKLRFRKLTGKVKEHYNKFNNNSFS